MFTLTRIKWIPQKNFYFCILVFFLAVCQLIGGVCHALEADQYRIWKSEGLKDVTQEVNKLINEQLNNFLKEKINRPIRFLDINAKSQSELNKHSRYLNGYIENKDPMQCQLVALKFMKYMRPNFFKNRLKKAIVKDDAIPLFPKEHHMFSDYRESIYDGFVWPFLMPVAQTLKINNVYLGTDKVDHFFSSGRRYYRVYWQKRKAGLSKEEAQKEAIRFGLNLFEEKGILGILASGAFSYADLEANFRGMRLAIDLCEGGKKSWLKLNQQGAWVVQHPVRMEHYVNPLWDEAFNNSYLAKYRRAAFKKKIKEEYCELGRQNKVRQLWRSYRQRLMPSLHTRFLQKLLKEGVIPNPKNQCISHICGYKRGVLEGVPFWKDI